MHTHKIHTLTSNRHTLYIVHCFKLTWTSVATGSHTILTAKRWLIDPLHCFPPLLIPPTHHWCPAFLMPPTLHWFAALLIPPTLQWIAWQAYLSPSSLPSALSSSPSSSVSVHPFLYHLLHHKLTGMYHKQYIKVTYKGGRSKNTRYDCGTIGLTFSDSRWK